MIGFISPMTVITGYDLQVPILLAIVKSAIVPTKNNYHHCLKIPIVVSYQMEKIYPWFLGSGWCMVDIVFEGMMPYSSYRLQFPVTNMKIVSSLEKSTHDN